MQKREKECETVTQLTNVLYLTQLLYVIISIILFK